MEDIAADPTPAEPPRRRRSVKLLASAVVLGLVGVIAGAGTWSAFSDTTENGGNSFSSGTVRIGDDDAGQALFTLDGLTPSSVPPAKCMVVKYTGSSDANVRIYGQTGGTGLADYVQLKVTRGSQGAAAPDCGASSATGADDFTADTADHQGDGPGVVYEGTLAGFADDFASADQEPAADSPEVWTDQEEHAYKFEVLLQSDDGAQGKEASQTFTWEARNTPTP